MKSSNPWGDSGTERKKFKISSMGETLYTTRGCSEVSFPYKKRPLRVDAPDRGGYAARKLEGEGAQEAGESPARSRHCDRGANPTLGHCREATAGRPGKRGSGSQETGPSSVETRTGRGPQRRLRGQNPQEITPHLTIRAGVRPDRNLRRPLRQRRAPRAPPRRRLLRGELPARALPRRPAPARRPLSLVAERDLNLPPPGPSGRARRRTPRRALRLRGRGADPGPGGGTGEPRARGGACRRRRGVQPGRAEGWPVLCDRALRDRHGRYLRLRLGILPG